MGMLSPFRRENQVDELRQSKLIHKILRRSISEMIGGGGESLKMLQYYCFKPRYKD